MDHVVFRIHRIAGSRLRKVVRNFVPEKMIPAIQILVRMKVSVKLRMEKGSVLASYHLTENFVRMILVIQTLAEMGANVKLLNEHLKVMMRKHTIVPVPNHSVETTVRLVKRRRETCGHVTSPKPQRSGISTYLKKAEKCNADYSNYCDSTNNRRLCRVSNGCIYHHTRCMARMTTSILSRPHVFSAVPSDMDAPIILLLVESGHV
ncbi:hypothetical protein TNCV_2336341 [Trichonephila clavipes]|uniref:Uncharacterized protein n=1 Tax=Trichonephila clavipes TaxID=2585209 RepID=A0A8X6VNJ5_TRICX|nr:hypothetical protein TNCV_2336341 [Trichonephila clavipes]